MTATGQYTIDDLLNLPEHGRWHELVQGELRPMSPANSRHGEIATQIAVLLRAYARQHKLGRVLVEGGYILSRSPDTVVAPDVSFIQRSRIPSAGLPETYFDGAPDLAVEIVSPNDSYNEIEEKIREYFRAGAALVWVVSPRSRSVAVHRPGAPVTILQDHDTLTCEDILPGFSIRVADIFETV